MVHPFKSNKTALAGRAFQNYAPRLWNGLPDDLRAIAALYAHTPTVLPHENSTAQPLFSFSAHCAFKRRLKTALFKTAFDVH